MYSEILSNIKTTNDLTRTKQEVDLLLGALYKSDISIFENALKGDVRQWLSDAILKETKNDMALTEKYLAKLSKELEKFKVLKLTLAYEPTQNMIERISSWVKTNVGADIVVDFSYNSGLIGGAVVVFKGEYRDFSLRKSLEDVFETNYQNVLQTLSK